MHPSYYYRAHCCILVFDVTRKITYQHLSDWYKELREYCPSIPCVLVANKIDVDYNVRTSPPPQQCALYTYMMQCISCISSLSSFIALLMTLSVSSE